MDHTKNHTSRLARLVLDPAWATSTSGRSDQPMRRAEFNPSLAARERALAAMLPDRSPDRRN